METFLEAPGQLGYVFRSFEDCLRNSCRLSSSLGIHFLRQCEEVLYNEREDGSAGPVASSAGPRNAGQLTKPRSLLGGRVAGWGQGLCVLLP